MSIAHLAIALLVCLSLLIEVFSVGLTYNSQIRQFEDDWSSHSAAAWSAVGYVLTFLVWCFVLK